MSKHDDWLRGRARERNPMVSNTMFAGSAMAVEIADELQSLQGTLDDALKEAAHQTDMANQANVACIGLQSRLDYEAKRLADIVEVRDLIVTKLSAAEGRLNGGIEVLEAWKAAADPRANDWSNLAEGALLILKGEVVERREQIAFEGNVADLPKYPAGHNVKGSE